MPSPARPLVELPHVALAGSGARLGAAGPASQRHLGWAAPHATGVAPVRGTRRRVSMWPPCAQMIRFEACAGPGSTGCHLPGCPRGSSPRPQGLSGEVAELRLLRRVLEEETGGHTLPHTLERLTLCCAWPAPREMPPPSLRGRDLRTNRQGRHAGRPASASVTLWRSALWSNPCYLSQER